MFEDLDGGLPYSPNRRITESERVFGCRILVLVLLALVAWLFRQVIAGFPHKIEYGYSRLLYPYLAEGVAWIPRMMPERVSATEAVLVLAGIGGAGWLGYQLYTGLFGDRRIRMVLLKIGFVGAALLAGLYFTYLMGWGLNYLRAPFSEALLTEEVSAVPSPDDYMEMTRDMMALANVLHQKMAERSSRQWVNVLDPVIDDSIRRVTSLTKPDLVPHPPPTKILMANELLSMFGISGFFSPFLMEPHINGNLLPWELPVIMAHEKAHYMGFASEADANLVAYISCLWSPSDHLRYAAALKILLDLNRVIGDERWQELVRDGLSEQVKQDIRSRNQRIRTYQRRYLRLFRFQRRINDLYLKLNSQELGVASYGDGMADLVRWWRLRQISGWANPPGQALLPVVFFR
jgi:uncharacterized membrane protein required for colicin V production